MGRWLSRDPIQEVGGSNIYRYAAGNPIGIEDRSGDIINVVAGGLGALGGGIVGGLGNLAWQHYHNGVSLSCINWRQVGAWAAGGAATGGLAGLTLGGSLLAEGAAAEEAGLGGTALARSLGQAGEDAVGITGPKVSIEIPGSAQIRIPDALTDTTLTEVKNVGSLSYTQQLRDFTTYSQANGLDFQLYVRPSTQLSGPLQQAITNGQINLNFIPGTP